MDGDDDCARRAWFRREILPLEPQLRAYLRRITPPDFDIDDLTHDVLVRLISAREWREVSSPAAFLRTTARNLVFDLLRRRQVVSLNYVAELDTAEFRSPEADAETRAIGRDELRALARLVSALPPQCRRVFVLRKVHGLAPGEIAARLGLSVSTVEKHLVKGLRICSEGLARLNNGEGGGENAAGREIIARARRSRSG